MKVRAQSEQKKVKKKIKKEEKKRRRTEEKNRHHRVPKSLGGTMGQGNISEVRITDHRAYHHLFQRFAPEEVAFKLTEKWLPLRVCLVCVPTDRVSEVLALLSAASIIPTDIHAEYGITDNHLRYHGSESEKIERQAQSQKIKKRPG